jgi:hypothetical protein
MGNFYETYTTETKKAKDLEKPEKERTEQGKRVISDDCFSLNESILELMQKIQGVQAAMMR